MEKYIPDMYQKSIYTIDYQRLATRGIKCLLFDLDNTMVPVNVKEPNDKLKELVAFLKEQNFNVIIFSNSMKNRVKPFKEGLSVDSMAFARKPKSKSFMMVLEQNNYKQTEVAIIGDQLLTDVVGGNVVGITTILVNPISKKDKLPTRINRIREKRIMRKLRDNNLFVKGRYYE